MRKFIRKRLIDGTMNSSSQKMKQQQELFWKVSRTFTHCSTRQSQHQKLKSVIKQQIRRPQTSKKVKDDYQLLMNLAECNKKIIQSRQSSILSIKKIKGINFNENKKQYEPLMQAIQNTEGTLYYKKHKRYSLAKFQKQLENKRCTKNGNMRSIQQFVEQALINGIKNLRNIIPQQAKLNEKLSLLGDLIQQQKQKHICQIKKLIQKQETNSQAGSQKLSKQYRIYVVNHYLMQRFMAKVYQDSSAIELKTRNSQIYDLIKGQMIGQIIKQHSFISYLDTINRQQQIKSGDTANIYIKNASKNRLQQKIYVSKHTNRISEATNESTTRNSRQSQIVAQFNNLYDKAKNNLTRAEMQLKGQSSQNCREALKQQNFFNELNKQIQPSNPKPLYKKSAQKCKAKQKLFYGNNLRHTRQVSQNNIQPGTTRGKQNEIWWQFQNLYKKEQMNKQARLQVSFSDLGKNKFYSLTQYKSNSTQAQAS